MALPERADERTEDRLCGRRDLEQRSPRVGGDRDQRRVGESGQLLAWSRRREDPAVDSEGEHHAPGRAGRGGDDQDPLLDEQEGRVGDVVVSADVARAKGDPGTPCK